MKKRPIPASAWAKIRLFAMDVDGILTDGGVFISSDKTETKRFCIIDGLGLLLVRASGVDLAWVSGRASMATTLRAKELKIPHLIQGRKDKLEALQELASDLAIPLSACAYMGDDFIDAPAIKAAGIGITVPTALPAAIGAADYVTRSHAGYGAVREVCDLILAARSPAARNRKTRKRT
jgi:3-deoxy-D-manno-octulosonate 8-phosphate phosphatase (KDO 8-P phosphatase)